MSKYTPSRGEPPYPDEPKNLGYDFNYEREKHLLQLIGALEREAVKLEITKNLLGELDRDQSLFARSVVLGLLDYLKPHNMGEVTYLVALADRARVEETMENAA